MHSLRLPLSLLGFAIVCVLAACSGGELQGSEGDGGAFDATATESGDDSAGGDGGVEAGNEATAEAGTDATMPPDAGTDATGDVASDGDADAPVYVYPDAGADCGIGPNAEPLDLACTGLYSDFTNKVVAPGVEPFAPGYVFWSDGALKSRWIALPAGQKIDTSSMDDWTFPVNTRIWKEFSLVLGGIPTRVETRLLWKQAPGVWYRTTYRWSADGTTSATELTSGEMNVAGTTYEIPSQLECADCHGGRPSGVLGFEAMALSAPAATGLTMAQLVSQNLVTTPPTGSVTIPGDPTAQAALGWLHINCGVACHNDTGGLASATNFWMRLNVGSLSSVQTTDTYTTGWNVPDQGYPIPGATKTYRFHACDVPESAAYYRADLRNGVNGTPPGTQMPPIVTHVVDNTDVAALAAWINEGCGDAGKD